MDASKTVLIIDDSQVALNQLTSALGAVGLHVLAANSGDKGLELFKANIDQVDLVITDIKMHGMNGMEVCKNIFSLKKRDPLPIMLLSAEYDPEEEQKFKEYGVVAWCIKPFEEKNFSHVVCQMLGVPVP